MSKICEERQLAITKGETYYSTGKPCPKGHLSKRNTKTRACYQCGLDWDKKRSKTEKRKQECRENHWKRKNYPSPTRSKPEKCELCGSLMMSGTKTIPDRCSDKTCPNHNPHKLNK